MILPFVMIIVTCLPVMALSQETAKATLTVNGSGHLSFQPDTAFITIGTETANASLSEAQRVNASVMQKLAQRLQDLHLEKERIQTTSFTVTPQYKTLTKRSTDVPQTPEIIGYTVTNAVTIEVRQLETVGHMIEEALGAGANRFMGLHWTLRNEQQAKLRALQQAAADAKDKATALSETLNVKLLRIQSAHENAQIIRPMAQASVRAMTDIASNEPPIFGGELRVDATVTLVYEIGP